MKKAKSSTRASTGRRSVPKTVDEYLASVPEPARSTSQKVRAAIRSAAPPEATEAISYEIPALRYNRVLVWFAAFSTHCSFFPTASVIEKFREELKGYTVSKGDDSVPHGQALAGRSNQKNGEGTHRGDEVPDKALTFPPGVRRRLFACWLRGGCGSTDPPLRPRKHRGEPCLCALRTR